MHRTQIMLDEHQYERLRAEAKRTGRSLGELVRLALDEVYRTANTDDLRRAFRASRGAWQGREIDGFEFVEHLRPGLGERRRRSE
jgi:Ribbon-helix-helix protein, copG family